MIPGSNILNMAFTIIAKEQIQYYQFISRSVNDIGYEVSVYADPVILYGSFQPVPRNLYAQYGLDFSRHYANFYTLSDMLDVTRDVSGDQISYAGDMYQCESNNDWFAVDGWKGVLVVKIPSS